MLQVSKTCLIRSILLVRLILLFIASANAQTNTPANSVTNPDPLNYLSSAIDTFNKRLTPEKIFVQTDKAFYTIGDTLWFKSYLFNGITGRYSDKSGIVYLDLVNDSLAVTKRISVPATIGLGWGQLVLSDELKEGFYTLRAYTRWMQNFGEESFYSKRIFIGDAAPNHWIIDQANSLSADAAKAKLNYSLQFKRSDNQALGYKNIQWKITDGKKTLARNSFEALNNRLQGSIELPGTVRSPLYMEATEKGNEGQRLSFPLLMESTPDIDLQFMPESGYLVAGLPCTVAFRAVDIYGKGTNVKGVIKNSRDEEINYFESSHKGMGITNVTPEQNEQYSAQFKLPDGTTKKVNLPAVKSSGTALQVFNYANSDTLRVYCLFTQDLLNGKGYKLLGLSNSEILFTANFQATTQRVSLRIPKSTFSTGIAHFTLFNEQNEPLNERITFINHNDNLDIAISSEKESYKQRDSIPLHFQVSNPNGKPVEASLSIAVTDDAQIKNGLLEDNIITRTFLTSELKGTVEDPAWYFNGSPDASAALDLVMLTHGWVGYKWKDILNKNITPAYAAERELMVTGKVLNILNKPVENAKMLLLARGKYSFIRDTVTNSAGRFVFNKFPLMDTVSFVVQSRTARNKSFGIGLEMDAPTPVQHTLKSAAIDIPWFVNIDSTYQAFVKNKQKMQAEEELALHGKNVIKEVIVAGKKRIPNSKNLNGPGEADQILDVADAQKAGNMPLIQFLQQYVKGFSVRPRDMDQFFYVNDKKVRFVVDGMELNRFYEPMDPPVANQYYNYIIDALSSLTAQEITGVEVMYNLKNTSQYASSYLTTDEMLGSMGRTNPEQPVTARSVREQFENGNNIAFLEITTRSGQGIFFRKTPGIAVYRPMPFTWPKEFYSPRYTAAAKPSKASDLRSTIFWSPNILSSKEGKAMTSFYASDAAGSYTVIVQGSDMNGLVGFKTFKLNIKK